MNYFEIRRNPLDDNPPHNDPNYVYDNYHCVINVGDKPYSTFLFSDNNIKSYWFPIHEFNNWGYSPFYAVAKILDNKIQLNDPKPILLHCMAGINRSACVAYTILKSNDIDIIPENVKHCEEFLFEQNVKKGYIPEDIIDFLKARHKNPDGSILELLRNIKSKNTVLKQETASIFFKGLDISK